MKSYPFFGIRHNVKCPESAVFTGMIDTCKDIDNFRCFLDCLSSRIFMIPFRGFVSKRVHSTRSHNILSSIPSLSPLRQIATLSHRVQLFTKNQNVHLKHVQPRRGILTASDLLGRKNYLPKCTISETALLSDAVSLLSDTNSDSLIVTSVDNSAVVGLITARDILRAFRSQSVPEHGATRSGKARTTSEKVAASASQPISVGAAMTPASSLVCALTTDSVASMAILMTELNLNHLPIVDATRNVVLGIATLEDIAALTYEGIRGGKESALRRVLPRKGLIKKDTRIGSSFDLLRARTFESHPGDIPPLLLRSLGVQFGAAAAPRPNPKRGEKDSEDSYFALTVQWMDPAALGGALGDPESEPSLTVPRSSSLFSDALPHMPIKHSWMGVADGVGSWAAYDVDSKQYSRALMRNSVKHILECATSGELPPTPMEVLAAGWKKTAEEGVIGSATASIVALDGFSRQVNIGSIGDCGVILLRNTQMDKVGTLLRGGTLQGIRPGWRVAARGMQQLKGFNLPYQLGYAGSNNEGNFQRPEEGESLVLPVQPGDILIVASDGLYDSLDETEILDIVTEWSIEEEKRDAMRRVASRCKDQLPPFSRTLSFTNVSQATASMHLPPVADRSDIPSSASLNRNIPQGSSLPPLIDSSGIGVSSLSLMLLERARVASLDTTKDGPFARLAKENDILWPHGGRPDDITIVVAKIDEGPDHSDPSYTADNVSHFSPLWFPESSDKKVWADIGTITHKEFRENIGRFTGENDWLEVSGIICDGPNQPLHTNQNGKKLVTSPALCTVTLEEALQPLVPRNALVDVLEEKMT